MSGELLDSGRDSGRASDAPTPIRKEKKRVGWHASSNGGASGEGLEAGYDSLAMSPSVTPLPQSVPHGAPDALELSRALNQILSDEEAQEAHTSTLYPRPHSDIEMTLQSGIQRPRPALRRNTSYDAPKEREEADRAEQQANERTLRSITDARHRADQLAISLGSHSAPGSRRNSDEMDASFQRLVGDSGAPHRGRTARPAVVIDDNDDDEYEDVGDNARPGLSSARAIDFAEARSAAGGFGGGDASGPHIRYRGSHQRTVSEDEPLDEHEIAANLVRSYKRKGKKGLFYSRRRGNGHASGTSTPISQQDYAQDYVPRPKQYRGGVLATLLKLANDESSYSGGGGGSTGSSGLSTPATATPVMSPQSSPPSSRSPSRVRRPGSSRRSSGLFNLHRSHGSASSLTLTELVKSSSMFAAPASTDVTHGVADKIKRESPHKSKKSKHRITVHIAGIISRHRYLLKLCRALMMYGAPTHRLEEYMIMSARVLEIEGQFLYIPSCMIISFDDSTTHTTEVKIVRVPQGIDLGRLRDVHNIYKDVVHDKLGVEEATKRLDSVMRQEPKFNVWFRVFLYGIASACVAPFAFQGRFIDLPFAFLLGALVGVLQLVFAPSNELYAHVFEVSASVLTSFLARAFGSINGGNTICFGALAQSSIALILPGYMVLSASLELQSYNIVSGSVRMVHAMIYTLFLGYGITIGSSLYGMLDRNATSEKNCENPLGREWYFLFVPGFTMCLCLVNQAKWKQTPVMLVMSLAGFVVNSYSSTFFHNNTEISNMLGALTVGILANLYSRLGRHFDNAWLDFCEFWQTKVQPRLSRVTRKRNMDNQEKWNLPSDTESRPGSPVHQQVPPRARRQVGYSLAAAAMLPAIFVQVPSGLAVGGSLLAGVKSADELIYGSKDSSGGIDDTAFNVLFKVIQVAIGISVGLFMSALIVYPLGKRRSGLFSF